MLDAQSQDWFAVLYPQTGALRLFPSDSLAKFHVAPSDMVLYGYRGPVDLQRRNDHIQLENLWLKIFRHSAVGWPNSSVGPLPVEDETTPPDCPTESLARSLWSLMQRVGDRVHKVGGPSLRSKDHYHLNLEKIRLVLETEPKRYPRQCQVILNKMLTEDEPYLLESTLKKLMMQVQASGELRTKQDSWLIFQFYRKRLIDDGLFSRGDEAQDDEE